jgi:hypothetical protein
MRGSVTSLLSSNKSTAAKAPEPLPIIDIVVFGGNLYPCDGLTTIRLPILPFDVALTIAVAPSGSEISGFKPLYTTTGSPGL